ncbi:MAG: dihydrodipicolinate synthase family protein [Candidatus Nanopelagicales bacterium]|nr:dihydrodipicolinate synthase family protein [Candidatus Nanopelagicales bacterium]
MKISGVLVALVTPFRPDGSIDEEGIAQHVNRMASAGIHGIVPLGTTGEFTTMTYSERCRVTELVLTAAAGRMVVLPHTGAQSTQETIALSQHAESAGAAGVMIVPPYYDPLRLNELHAHLRAVGEVINIPIVYYNVPGATGLQLSPAQLAALGDLPNVEYIKDTSGDFSSVSTMLLQYPNQITTFNGWDTLTFGALATGATGAVWGMANLLPEQAVKLYEALVINGDLAEGRRLWAALWPVCNILESHNYVAAIKAGLDEIGLSAGPVRAPLQPISAADSAELAVTLRRAQAL